jgi:hypothetical protein
MSIEHELRVAAKSASEGPDGLLTRAANEIRALRTKLSDAERGRLNAAVASTTGKQGPVET